MKELREKIEESKKWIGIALRKAIFEGYDAGKKQHKTPYDYTLDTDKIGEKHFKIIMGQIEQLLLERDKEVVEVIEEIGFDSENPSWNKNLIIGCREPNELGLWSYAEFKNRNELLKTLKKD